MFLKSKGFFFAVLIILSICFLGYSRYEKEQGIIEIFETPYISEVRSIFNQKFEAANYSISELTFWDTELDGTTPKKALKKKASTLYKRYRVLGESAINIGMADDMDIKITNSDSWKDIQKRMESWSQLLESDLISAMTEEEVRVYYDSHLDNFRKQDEIEGSLSFWQNGVEVWSKDLSITEKNIKVITEEYDDLTNVLSSIQSGAGESWNTPDGTYYFVCQNRLSGGIKSFDDVIEAAAAQYAQEKLEKKFASMSH